MSIETSGTIQAMCTVDAGGAAFLAGSKAPGFIGTANAGVGLNNLTLDQEVDQTQSAILATPRSTVAGAATQTLHISDSVKQVRTYVGGVLSDLAAFDCLVFRFPNL